MISEEQLKKATSEVEEILMAVQPDWDACEPETSPKFERKMKSLIRKRKHPILFHPMFRAAAVLLLIILLSGTVILGIPEVKASFVGLFYEEEEHSFRYVLTGHVDTDDLRTYELGYIPEGYAQTSERYESYGGKVKYENQDGATLLFEYHVQRQGGESEIYYSFKSANYELKDTIVNGHGADLFAMVSKSGRKVNRLLWMNGERSILFSIYWIGMNENDDVRILAESVIANEIEE